MEKASDVPGMASPKRPADNLHKFVKDIHPAKWFLVDLAQNLALVATLVLGLGSGASFMSAHVDVEHARGATFGMIELLADELALVAQLNSTQQQVLVLAPSVVPPPPPPAPPPGLREARDELRLAAANWSTGNYEAVQSHVRRGLDLLGRDVPLEFDVGLLLDANVTKLDPLLERLGFKVPLQAARLGWYAFGSGCICATTAALGALRKK